VIDESAFEEDVQRQLRAACAALERSLRAGEACKAEDWFRMYPALATHKEAALELVYAEFVCREQLNQQPTPEEWYSRFPEWRVDLEQLFQVHQLAKGTSRLTTEAVPSVADLITDRPGTVIGPYKLLEQIGEGGFGVVFMAEQTQPVRRKVALKILKPGMDTRQVVARFEAERQALAIMDHPNIAKVLDGGATPSGRPYFVMDLVKGVPITDFCDQNHLTPRQRLELFVPVSQAVQHAHQKGIVHRDLKPSNVIVTVHDTTPVPKIIDFGVAKALGQELTDKTLFTGFAQLIGTPLYMSPEQAGQSGLDIDTRSDIYSLGVLLYELLTGTTPFTKERFKQATYDEIRRIIREEDPPKPSARLSDLGRSGEYVGRLSGGVTPIPSLASVSAQRHMEPAKLTKLVRGELDWIVMKALEKDRNRRYETANGFAIDVRRYLADEPVQACPPSAGYRLRKLAHKNKRLIVTAAIIMLLMVVGLFVSSITAVRFQKLAKELDAKRIEAEDGKTTAEEAQDEAQRARKETERHLRHAEEEAAAKDRARRRAEGLYLSSRSSALLPTNPDLALLLAIEGARRHVSPVTNHSLLAALDGATEHRTLIGHPYEVLTARFSSDGRRVLTTFLGGDMTARIWDAAAGKELLVLKAPRAIQSAVFSPDGRLVLTGSGLDATPRVWDAVTGKEIATLKGQLWAQPGAFSPDSRRVVTPAEDNTARVSDAATGKAVLVLRAHTAPVRSATFSPDGRRLLTVSADQTVRVWDADAGIERARLDWLVGKNQIGTRSGTGQPLPAEVKSAEFSPDGERVITTDSDYVGRIWSARTGKELVTLRYGVDYARFSPDGKRVLAWSTRAQDAYVQIRDATTGEETVRLQGHSNGIPSAEFSPDGRRVVTASYDGTVRLWDAAGGKELATLRGHQGRVNHASFSPDGRWVTSASDDRTARVWSTQSGKERATLLERSNAQFLTASPDGKWVVLPSVRFIAALWDIAGGQAPLPLPEAVIAPVLSPDGKQVVAVRGNAARVWNAATGAEHAVLLGHTDLARSARFSPDGTHLVTASDDRTARTWESATGRPLLVLTGHAGGVSSAVFSPDGRRVLTAAADRTARVWDAVTGKELLVLRGHTDMVRVAAYGLDGRRVVTTSADHTGRAWDAETGKEMASAAEVEERKAPEVSADGRRWLTYRSFTGTTVRLWDLETGKELLTLRVPGGHLQSAALSPDGDRIVTAAEDGAVRVWEAATGKELPGFRPLQGVSSAVFSPDGRQLLTTENDSARLLDAATGRELSTVFARAGRVLSVAFAPGGRRVLATFMRDTVSIWDLAARTETVTEQGHAWQILSAAFSPDGRRFVSASSDRTARVWETATGKAVAVVVGHEGPVYTAVFSPDGQRVATLSDDHTARVWEAATGKEVAVLKGHTDKVRLVTFSPDGRRLLTVGMDPVPRVWDAATGRELFALRGHEASVAVALFSPDGRHIFTGASGSLPIHERRDGKRQVFGLGDSKDRTARLWDAATGRQKAVLAQDGTVWSAAFSPDGRRLVTRGDKGVRLWDPATGREALALKGTGTGSVAFGPDGRQLLIGGGLWDTATGRQVLALEGEGGFRAVAFAASGQRLVTLSSIGTVRTWPCDPLAEALERKPRDLTPEERAAFAIDAAEGP
jgi:WD40 repeat protein/serine/threonine protein kinase